MDLKAILFVVTSSKGHKLIYQCPTTADSLLKQDKKTLSTINSTNNNNELNDNNNNNNNNNNSAMFTSNDLFKCFYDFNVLKIENDLLADLLAPKSSLYNKPFKLEYKQNFFIGIPQVFFLKKINTEKLLKIFIYI